jgi:hypothetical protein
MVVFMAVALMVHAVLANLILFFVVSILLVDVLVEVVMIMVFVILIVAGRLCQYTVLRITNQKNIARIFFYHLYIFLYNSELISFLGDIVQAQLQLNLKHSCQI